MKITELFSICLLLFATLALSTGCVAQGPNLGDGSGPATPQEEESFPEILLKPTELTEKAPETFKVEFKTNEGDFVIECTRSWAPNGCDRFYNMVKNGYFKNIYIFRAVKGFMFQFGIHGNPKVTSVWQNANIKDDPSKGQSNVPGTISFAQTGAPNSRSCQMFINMGSNTFLDQSRGGGAPFVPFGKVVSGQATLGKINTEYGENDPRKNIQGKFSSMGNSYIKKEFPNLSFIISAKLVKPEGAKGAASGTDKE